jgi:RNA polymerase sigma-70 factor (ECF subfamily)
MSIARRIEVVGLDAVVGSEAREFANRVQQHSRLLVRLAARIAGPDRAEDVVQDALLRAWRYRSRYDAGRGPFENWLLAIVANEARRALKARRTPWHRHVVAVDSASASDARIDLERSLGRLPPRQRSAIDCYYFVGLSISQTAAVMGCAEGTVKSTLADARARLRTELRERER